MTELSDGFNPLLELIVFDKYFRWLLSVDSKSASSFRSSLITPLNFRFNDSRSSVIIYLKVCKSRFKPHINNIDNLKNETKAISFLPEYRFLYFVTA